MSGQATEHPTSLSSPVEFLPDVETWVMRSNDEREHQIWVALPDGYQTEGAPYPVLIATDANSKFGTVVETARILAATHQIPKIIVVGLGYPMPGQAMKALHADRTYDLTPTASDAALRNANEAVAPAGSGVPLATKSGGGPAYLEFIRAKLLPTLYEDFHVKPDDNALYGHSLGGLFASSALFHLPHMFQRFVISSPSLWWDSRALFSIEQTYAAATDRLGARVFLSVGSEEEEPTCNMVQNLWAFATALGNRRYEGLESETCVFEGENHVSVIPAAISRGLRYIYARAS